MKVLTVVGARPQFVKAAVVSRVLRKKHTEILVHTGQHFDYNMSERFFEELDIPQPNYNLGISGGTHAQMTGRMMIAVEEVLLSEYPDWLLIYGDTNSTLAAALAAAKVRIPICHVEAGARVHSMTNPEEVNRICTDHISTLCLAVLQSGYDELTREGLAAKSRIVGDPMYEAFLTYSKKLRREDIVLHTLDGESVKLPESFYYLTCHREENTDTDSKLKEILIAMNQLSDPTIYPVHPRNMERTLRLLKQNKYSNVICTVPIGYLESTCLVRNALKIVTDSGGLQREAFFAEKKCVTIFDYIMCPETMIDGRNSLSTPKSEEILNKLNESQKIEPSYLPFGDGKAAEKIVREMELHHGNI